MAGPQVTELFQFLLSKFSAPVLSFFNIYFFQVLHEFVLD